MYQVRITFAKNGTLIRKQYSAALLPSRFAQRFHPHPALGWYEEKSIYQ